MKSASGLAKLASKYGSDKGFDVLNAHGYTRVYESLLRDCTELPVKILEIGLLHPSLHAESGKTDAGFCAAPSLQMWAEYLPNASIFGLDIENFSGVSHPRITVLQADQGHYDELRKVVGPHVGEGFDLIIDDGSHASHHQQISLGALWPFLKSGGIYVIEDLHYQPAELEVAGITKTAALLDMLRMRRSLNGLPCALLPPDISRLEQEVGQVLFFDSLDAHRPHCAMSMDALAVIQKRS
jgi:hypothetical protein